MGASQSIEACQAEEGVTVVSTGAAGRPQRQSDEVILQQLASLKHSLPIIPDSIASESSSMWSRSLQRLPVPGPPAHTSASRSRERTLSTHLDATALAQLAADYQRFVRHQSRLTVHEQDKLVAAIPRLEQQAAQVHHQAAEAVKHAVTGQANFRVVGGVQQELEVLAARLGRLQQALIDVEAEVQQHLAGRHAADPAAARAAATGAAAAAGAPAEPPSGSRA